MSQTTIQPELDDVVTHDGGWVVVIFNNDTNTFDEVIRALMEATGCDMQEAIDETIEAHITGQAVVHHASQQECLEVAAVIKLIGVRTEVWPEDQI